MRKRIGNDVSITWDVTRNGEAYDLSGLPVSLKLQNFNGDRLPLEWYVEGSMIHGTCYGKDQSFTGKVYWELVVNDGLEDMQSIDGYAFHIVDKTSKENPEDEGCVCLCCDLEDAATEIHVSTKTALDGRKGDDGLSAYELAVQNGFVGTLAEWLESLKPKPRFSVGDDGYMYVTTD